MAVVSDLERLREKEEWCKKRYPRISETALKRMAKNLLDVDNQGEEDDEDEFDRRQALERHRDKLLSKRLTHKTISGDTFLLEQEQRVEKHAQKAAEAGAGPCPFIVKSDHSICDPNHVNYRNPNNFGRTVLHCATIQNNLLEVKRLVEECNADPNVGDNSYFTPRQIARVEGYSEIEEYLKNK